MGQNVTVTWKLWPVASFLCKITFFNFQLFQATKIDLHASIFELEKSYAPFQKADIPDNLLF